LVQFGDGASHSEQFAITDEQRMHALYYMKLPLTHVEHAVSEVQVMHGDTHGGGTALLS
jgi:hypothetical protein